MLKVDKTRVELLATLKKIAQAGNALDEGKGIPEDKFFSQFKKSTVLKEK